MNIIRRIRVRRIQKDPKSFYMPNGTKLDWPYTEKQMIKFIMTSAWVEKAKPNQFSEMENYTHIKWYKS